MITAGTASAVDYGIKPRDDGRFEIAWESSPTTDANEEESTEAAAQADTGATGGESAGAASDLAPSEEAATAPALAPATAAEGSEQDPALARFETPRLIAELARRGYRTAEARQSRSLRPASGRRQSKAAELDAAAARGVMPTKPVVTSHWNYHYQRRFDKLAELAAAGDWDAVAAYECNGLNSYSKMVRQYRDRLVAAHKAQ
jgi:hypothetical protein